MTFVRYGSQKDPAPSLFKIETRDNYSEYSDDTRLRPALSGVKRYTTIF